MLKRYWAIIVGAILAVLIEVTVAVFASSITVPRKLFLIPPAVLALLVALQVVLSGRSTRHTPLRRNQDHATPRPGGKHEIKGLPARKNSRQREAGITFLIMAGSIFTVGGLALDGVAYRKEDTIPYIVVFALSVPCALLGLWLIAGFRTCLVFSAAGITVLAGGVILPRDHPRRRNLRWNEAVSFQIKRYDCEFDDDDNFVDGTWLVAKPIQGSEWFRQRWDFDETRKVILICNLTKAGITPSAVSSAIAYWTSERRSKRGLPAQ